MIILALDLGKFNTMCCFFDTTTRTHSFLNALTDRDYLTTVFKNHAVDLVVMEACGTAHYWGRRCQAHGHHVQLLPVQYVKPYVRRNKTDRMDTEALLEAARCAGIQPLPVKTPEQQALQVGAAGAGPGPGPRADPCRQVQPRRRRAWIGG